MMAVIRSRIDQKGRIVIPPVVRRRLRVEPGDEIVFDVGCDEIVLSSHNDAVIALKQLVRGLRPPYSVAAFLGNRRRLAAQESRTEHTPRTHRI